jgi:hypothetical protein
MKKSICLIISLFLIFSFTACNKDIISNENKSIIIDSNYTYEKKSDNMLLFESSDSSLDSFLNEYMERHLSYNNKAIYTETKLGDGKTPWKEWEAMSLMFFDSTAGNLGYDGKEKIKSWVNNIYQDNQGYVWMSDGIGENWGQGWPFPNYSSSKSRTVGFEFQSDSEGWISSPNFDYSSGKIYASANDDKHIVFQSSDFSSMSTHSPFVEMGLTFIDSFSFGGTEAIDDMYLYFQTDTEPFYSEDKKVSYKEFATNASDLFPNIQKISFPMYLNEKWNSGNTYITKLKLDIVAKTAFYAEASLDYVNLNYDARQSNNNSILLATAKKYFEYTQDLDFLKNNIVKLRKAMQFMLTQLNGIEGLIDNSYFPGHDGIRGVGHGIGDGYWDLLALPSVNIYCNTYFYKAVCAMEYLEKICTENNIVVEDSEIKNSEMTDNVKYSETVSSLSELKTKIVDEFSKEFWDSEKGRFYAGTNSNGIKNDYGYVMFNLEAISSGLSSETQSKLIFEWINGDRIIEGENSTGEDIYLYEFAPRTTTLHNTSQYYWGWNGKPFSEQVQDGGVVMQESYYDLDSRVSVLGVDNAFTRLKGIQTWYEKVKAEGGEGADFYRAYYDKLGYKMQGGGSDGGIGLDYEFLEASILYASIPESFFGLKSESTNVLTVNPNLPSNLDWWKMENLTYSNLIYDLSIGSNFVQINNTRGNNTGYKIKVVLDKPDGSFIVRQHTTTITDYQIIGDKVIIEVPFINGKVQTIKL